MDRRMRGARRSKISAESTREHARRGITSASREQLLADAIQLDEEDKSAEADAKYKELSYPVPPSVDA